MPTVNIDASESNPDGGFGLGPGIYHVIVSDVKINEQGKLETLFECVAGRTAEGDEKGCKGKTKKEFFVPNSPNPKVRDRAFQAAAALRWITREQWKEAKEANRMLSFDAEKGAQCVVEVKMEESKSEDPKYKGKEYPQIGFRFSDVNDPKVSHCPKDPTFMGMLGGDLSATAASTEDSPYGGF